MVLRTIDKILDITKYLKIDENYMMTIYCRYKKERVNQYIKEQLGNNEIQINEMKKISIQSINDTLNYYSDILITEVKL